MKRVTVSLVLLTVAAPQAGAQTWGELVTLQFYPEARFTSPGGSSAGPYAGAEADEAARVAEVVELTETIGRGQAANGENWPGLVDDLVALAVAHQQLGDHAEAIVALDRAQHIIRVAEGLYSLDQTGVVEMAIDSLSASADYFDTLPLESYLQELAWRNPGDPRVVSLLTRIGDRRMAAARHFLDNGIPPTLQISIRNASEARWLPRNGAPTRERLALASLGAARRNYADALQVAVDDGHAVSDLLELEDRIVDTLYFELEDPGFRRYRSSRNRGSRIAGVGVRVLQTKLTNSHNFPGTPDSIARARVELADWHLMFSANGTALDGYETARSALVESAADPEAVAALFSPAAPVALPAYGEVDESFGCSECVEGFFDADVEIGRYGRVTDLTVVRRSESATDILERRFRGHIRNSRYRPRFIDGALARRDAFRVRYRFSYERER